MSENDKFDGEPRQWSPMARLLASRERAIEELRCFTDPPENLSDKFPLAAADLGEVFRHDARDSIGLRAVLQLTVDPLALCS